MAANATRQRKSLSGASARSSDGSDSEEADLSDYTFDLDKLAGGVTGTNSAKQDAPKAQTEDVGKTDNASFELGGPADFTLNLVEHVRGDSRSNAPSLEEPAQDIHPDDHENSKEQDSPSKSIGSEPANSMVPEEYSEFDPPLDMSTPAHILARRKSQSNDESILKTDEHTRMLYEGSSKIAPVPEEPELEDHDVDFQAEVVRLKDELRKKDEIIQANEKRVLDAASVAQQIRHLQTELQKQSSLLKDREALEKANCAQQDEINYLKSELETKNKQLGKKSDELERLKSTRQQEESWVAGTAAEEQRNKQIKAKSAQSDLSFLRDQLEEKNKALDQTSSKFQETMSAHETRLQEKIAEIDILKAQQGEQCLELDRLDSELDAVMRERDYLQKRTEDLDKIIHHMETQLDSLKAELSQLKSRADTEFNALKSLATGVSVDVEDQSSMAIIGSLKTFYESNRKSAPSKVVSFDVQEKSDRELGDLHDQLQESTSLTRILNLQLESTKEELVESKSLGSTLQRANSHLEARIEELMTEKSKLHANLLKLTDERDGAMRTLDELRSQTDAYQQPSPPSSPHLDSKERKFQEAFEAASLAHQAEVRSIQSAHATTLSAIRDSHTETTQSLHALLSAAQQRETELQAELIALRKTAASKESEMTVLKCEKDRLESVIEAKDATATAMDTKFANVLKKREEIWESRVERLLGDRERMSKVLLWTWGEKEIGVGKKREAIGSRKSKGSRSENRQGYKYKYVQRDEDKE